MPNRILREGILSSERVAELGWPEEVFYRRLMSVVDDYGRFYANPSLLHAFLYPLQLSKVSDSDIGKWLTACVTAALVRVYPAKDGKRYLELLDFRQQVRAKESKFPAFDAQLLGGGDADATHLSSRRAAHAPVFGDGDGDGDGVEGVLGKDGGHCPPQIPADAGDDGNPKSSKAERGKRLPKDWLLPRPWGEWALAKYPHWTPDIVRDIALTFRNHWVGKSGKDATKLDWEATWQNWCIRDITQKQYPPPRAVNGQPQSFRERDAEAAAQRISNLTGGTANAPLRNNPEDTIDVVATELHQRRLA